MRSRLLALMLVFTAACSSSPPPTAPADPPTDTGSAPPKPPTTPPPAATNGPPAMIVLTPSVDTMAIQGTLEFGDTVKDSAGHVLSTAVTWHLSNIATLSLVEPGIVLANVRGIDTVTATAPNGVTAHAVIYVASPTVTLVGALTDGGSWFNPTTDNNASPLSGDAAFLGSPYNVQTAVHFVERTAAGDSVGVDSVAAITSAAFYAPSPTFPAAPGAANPALNCPIPTSGFALLCAQTSGGSGPQGEYLITVTPAPIAGAVNPSVTYSFYLEVVGSSN